MIYSRSQITADTVTEILPALILQNALHVFYTSTAWLKLRNEVLTQHNHECQHCKAKGIYTRATTVHHERYVRDWPALALSKHYTDTTGHRHRQLTPLCDSCHKIHHGNPRPSGLVTPERWD